MHFLLALGGVTSVGRQLHVPATSEVLVQLLAPALLLEMAWLARLAVVSGCSRSGISGPFNRSRVF